MFSFLPKPMNMLGFCWIIKIIRWYSIEEREVRWSPQNYIPTANCFQGTSGTYIGQHKRVKGICCQNPLLKTIEIAIFERNLLTSHTQTIIRRKTILFLDQY